MKDYVKQSIPQRSERRLTKKNFPQLVRWVFEQMSLF